MLTTRRNPVSISLALSLSLYVSYFGIIRRFVLLLVLQHPVRSRVSLFILVMMTIWCGAGVKLYHIIRERAELPYHIIARGLLPEHIADKGEREEEESAKKSATCAFLGAYLGRCYGIG
jgi:hypothetical protein